MKKWILWLSSILLLVVLVSGQEDFEWVTATRIGNPNAEIVLTAVVQRESSPLSPYVERREYVIKKATEWAKAHPNVRIELQVPPAGQISANMAKLLTQAEAGNAPDFAHIDSFWIGTFVDAGYLQPLNPYLTPQDIDAFLDFTKEVTVRDGKMYAIWGETDVRFLYYRKDWIDTPPRTWDEVIEIGLKIKEEHPGVIPYLTAIGPWEGAANEGTWPYLWAQGGEIFDPETGEPVIGVGKNKEALINVFNYHKKLVDTGVMPLSVISYTGLDPILAEAQADRVAMLIEGSWAYNQLKQIVEDFEQKWDFTHIPQMEADQYGNSAGGWTWAVFTDDPVKQELAVDYIMYTVGSKEAMAERCKLQDYVPTRSDVFETDPYFSTNSRQQKYYEALQYARPRPAHPLYVATSDLIQKAVGDVILGRKTPEEAVDEIQTTLMKDWERINSQQ